MSSWQRMSGLAVCFAVAQTWCMAEEPQGATADKPVLERWDRAVCLVTSQKVTDHEGASGSGFIVADQDQYFLITAAHVARDTHARTRLVYRTVAGESRWVHLAGVVQGGGNPWREVGNTDLAIARVQMQEKFEVYFDELCELAIPRTGVICDLPRRTEAIEIVGFPMGYGAEPPVSSLVMPARIASREMPGKTAWGSMPVFYAVPAVGAGCSGGPVFLATPDAETAQLVGVFMGMEVDGSGAKLSRILPARLLESAFESGLEGSDQ